VVADFMDGEDVRVVQRRGGTRLLQEAGEALRVDAQFPAQDLECDRPVECRVEGLVDLAHTTAAEERLDVIAADCCADGEGHSTLKLYPVIAAFACGLARPSLHPR
jgi:hypothetical protein